MYILEPTSRFERALKRLTKRNPDLEATITEILIKLQQSPRDPALRSHKVRDDEGQPAYSSRVTGDLRVIWRYKSSNGIILLNIGGHSGGNKVYS